MRNFFLLLFHLCFEKKFRKPKPFFSFSEKEKNKNKNYENSRVKDAKIAKKKRKHYANENTNCHTSHLHACRVFGRWLAHMWLAQTHTKCIENKNDAKPRTDMSLYLHLFYFIFFAHNVQVNKTHKICVYEIAPWTSNECSVLFDVMNYSHSFYDVKRCFIIFVIIHE